MSIFRTIKKLRDCETCEGTGKVRVTTAAQTDSSVTQTEIQCPICEGTGKVEILARVSQAAAGRAATAAKNLPPQLRAVVKERLQDHEPPSKDLPKRGKESKVGSDVVDED